MSPSVNLVREKVPFFALAAASSVVTLLAHQSWEAVKALDVLPFQIRLANALVAYNLQMTTI